MHQPQLDAGLRQLVQGVDDDPAKGEFGIVQTVIARPGVEQVAQNVEVLGLAGASVEKIQEDPGSAGSLQGKVQVGNE